jgi:hypothetical protein
MARTRVLNGDDLKLHTRPALQSASQQRGAFPSDALVPMQFRMQPEFAKRFKQEALNRGVKLNELFALAFDALLKT